MITMNDIRIVVLANIPFDTGFMYMNGTRFIEDSTKYSIIYDGNAVPYIPYTEYKWVSPRWKGTPNPNEGWIRTNTVNDLDLLINKSTTTEAKGIKSFNTKTAEARQRLVDNKRNSMLSQGTLESIKGNMNR